MMACFTYNQLPRYFLFYFYPRLDGMSLDNCLKHMYMYNQKVISKLVTRLLRLTTLFNLFCVAQIVDCDHINTRVNLTHTLDKATLRVK